MNLFFVPGRLHRSTIDRVHVRTASAARRSPLARTAVMGLRIGITLALLALASCASPAATVQSPAAGTQVSFEGQVTSVDAEPLTYDGDALVVVASAAHGPLTVHLPARWNLCKGTGMDVLAALKPGDRVQVVGTVTGPGDVVVCDQASHRLSLVR